MARTLYRLTDKIMRNLAAPGYHADGGGLYLQISKAGTKSWIYRFTLRGRTRDMGLGSAQAVSLTAARATAGECRTLIAKGIDPIEHAKAQREGEGDDEPAKPTGQNFRDFAEQYINARSATWRSAKHADQWRATLAAYAYPVIGDMALAAIDTPDILRVLEPMWGEKSETASRVRGRIERIETGEILGRYIEGQGSADLPGVGQVSPPTLGWAGGGELITTEGPPRFRLLELVPATIPDGKQASGAATYKLNGDLVREVIPVEDIPPPPAPLTATEKLAAAGLAVDELKQLLA